jgi:Ran GTPase-activating protein (RanGAP) involved in mRNA processing and transport
LDRVGRCTWLEALNGSSVSWYREIGTKTHTALDAGARGLEEDGAAIVGILALLPSAGSLTALDMSGNSLDFAGVMALTNVFSSLVLLRELWLGYNDFGTKGAFVAGDLSTLTSLEVLDLQGNRFFDSGGPELAQGLRLLTSLRELYLQYNDLGNQSGTALAEAVSAMTLLEVLDLDGNKMGKEVCQAVASSLAGLTRLRSLDMQRNTGALEVAKTIESMRSPQLPGLELVISDGILEGSGLDS